MDAQAFSLLLKLLLEKELKKQIRVDGKWLIVNFEHNNGYAIKVLPIDEKPYMDKDTNEKYVLNKFISNEENK